MNLPSSAVSQLLSFVSQAAMPGMDGLETLQQLQANPQTQAIPVIFLTAKVQPAEQAAYQRSGVAGLIVKPFDPVQISQDIRQLLGWHE